MNKLISPTLPTLPCPLHPYVAPLLETCAQLHVTPSHGWASNPSTPGKVDFPSCTSINVSSRARNLERTPRRLRHIWQGLHGCFHGRRSDPAWVGGLEVAVADRSRMTMHSDGFACPLNVHRAAGPLDTIASTSPCLRHRVQKAAHGEQRACAP